ncbi:IS66 family transposase [Pararobbsia alpina]|uniref:IS66 family transposase n=1 Tax=Pararobbsia alpina TaxID=621374 RepID=UPI003CCDF4C8
MHADGFAGYDKIYADGVRICMPMAYVSRRHAGLMFDASSMTSVNRIRHPSPVAGEAVKRIGELHAIETQIRGKPPNQRLATRQAQTQPLLDNMRAWMITLLPSDIV